MFTVYGALGPKRNACTHYRLFTPLRSLMLANQALPLIEEHTNLSNDDVERADFHLYYMRASRRLLARVHQYNRTRALKHPLRDSKAPHVVFDSDDHIDDLSIWNPRFVKLGTRFPDGTKMQKGDEVQIEYPDEGVSEVLWKDGLEYYGETFNVEENKALIRLLQIFARACSGVTCSTEYLAQAYRKIGCKNVYVYPNSLLPDDYPEVRIERRKKLTILWQGGHSHYEDWLTIIHPLREVLARNPDVQFVLWGQEFPAVRRAVPDGQYEHIPWTDYEKYTLRLATIGHQINICPLIDNSFNRAKSAIKWLESSAITRPAVTLAANVGPYQEIEHGVNGLKYNNEEEFATLLQELIDDGRLRMWLAARAHEYAWDNYNALDTAKKLAEWYRGMLFRDMR